MTQKTAIDILIEDLLSGKLMEVLSNKERYKEIEKRQIIDAWLDGGATLGAKNAQQYYEQTFGNSPSPSK